MSNHADDGIVNAVNGGTGLLPVHPAIRLALQAPTAAAGLAGNIYTGSASTENTSLLPWEGVHANYDTYTELSDAMWGTPADNYTAQKDAINRFLGGTHI